MAGFLYFLPGLKGVQDKDISKRGLEAVIGPSRGVGEVTGAGPSGGPGAMVAEVPTHPDGAQPEINYQPDLQAWAEGSKADGGWWVGFWLDAPPGPEDLQRATSLDGYWAETQGGQRWITPIARHYDLGTASALDCGVYLGTDGELVEGPVLAKYRTLSAHGDRVWESFCHEEGIAPEGAPAPAELGKAESFKIAVEALAFNYRIGLVEASLLGKRGLFLTKAAVRHVLVCLFDMPGWIAVQAARTAAAEKNLLAGTPSGSNT